MRHETKRLFLIDDDVAAIQSIKARLQASRYLQVSGEATQVEEVWAGIREQQIDVVLIGSIRQTEIGILCQQIRLQYPHILFIAACSAHEMHWEPFFRNLGIWVIAKPVEPMQIEILSMQISMPTPAISHMPIATGTGAAIGHIKEAAAASATYTPSASPMGAEQPSAHPKPHKKQLITVYGPKGGVGKTFLSRELAIHFARQEKEGRQLKVLAVDFNLDLGTIATSLNMPRTPNLFTWVKEIDEQLQQVAARDGRDPAAMGKEEWQRYLTRLSLTKQNLQKYVVVHPDTNLHVLTSPRDIRQSFEIQDYHLYVMLESLKQSDYDIVLIDTAPDTTDATIQALFFAEKVVMVGNPVVDAIENIQRMLKLLREAEFPEEKIQLCINRLQRKEMFSIEEIRAYFQLHPAKVMYTIPDDPEVKRSINSGIPLMLSPGKSAAKEAIEQLARALVASDEAGTIAKPREKEPKKRSSLFAWLRKA